MTPTDDAITKTLEDLRKVQGTALLIGGLAVRYFGYKRQTNDVDILYAQADGKILQRLKKDFRVVLRAKNGWHHLDNKKTGVRLELIPEGGLTTYGFIPGPKIVGGQDGFISLFGLVWLKLVSGRTNDCLDLVSLGKLHLDEMNALKEKLPPDIQDRYAELLEQARREMEDNPGTVLR